MLGGRLHRRGLDARERSGLVRTGCLVAPHQGGQIQPGRLVHETSARVGVEHVPEPEDVTLAVRGEFGTQRLGAVRIGGFAHLAPLGQRWRSV